MVIETTFTTDPWAGANGGGDYMSLIIQIFAWWILLFWAVDMEG